MPEPFFSIFMRACNRPMEIIERSITSVTKQTCKDFELVVAVDDKKSHPGGNILFANSQFYRYRNELNGLYVIALDDDSFFVSRDFFKKAKRCIVENDYPGCLLVHSRPGNRQAYSSKLLPCNNVWDIEWEKGERPEKWCGNGGNWVCRYDIFKRLSRHYRQPRGGDWFFMMQVCNYDTSMIRCDVVGSGNDKRGYGKQGELLVDWNVIKRKYKFTLEKKGLMRL